MDDLSESKAAIRKALEFVTDEDADHLFNIGQLASIADGKPIIEEGSGRRRLIILIAGRGRVLRTHLGSSITVSTAASPEVLGEVAYFDQLGASASVISDGPSRVLNFEDAQLDALLLSGPGIGRQTVSIPGVSACQAIAVTDRQSAVVSRAGRAPGQTCANDSSSFRRRPPAHYFPGDGEFSQRHVESADDLEGSQE